MDITKASVSATAKRGIRVLPKSNRLLVYLLASCLAAIFTFPFFWTVSGSLKSASEMYVFPPLLLPAVPQFRNYIRVMEVIPFALWFKNSVFVVALSTLGRVTSSVIVGYAFARFSYPGKDLLFLITLSTMMLPSQVTLIPQFIVFHKLGWLDTFKPLWVPAWFGGGAFYIFLMRQFIQSLPREMDEAAFIDGAGRLHVLWSIIIPLCKPVLATAAIISFMAGWADFLNPVIYLNTREKFTLAVGLRYFRTVPETSSEPLHHILMAASVATTLPSLVIFFAFQRYFVHGVVMSGIKG